MKVKFLTLFALSDFLTTVHSTSSQRCPPGAPLVNCQLNPCSHSTAAVFCPNFPTATCRPDYCGGCNMRWYSSVGVEVTNNCSEGSAGTAGGRHTITAQRNSSAITHRNAFTTEPLINIMELKSTTIHQEPSSESATPLNACKASSLFNGSKKVSMDLTAGVIAGGVVGIIVLSVIIFLLSLALVHQHRKHRVMNVFQDNCCTLDMDMNQNKAYISASQEIPTNANIAYSHNNGAIFATSDSEYLNRNGVSYSPSQHMTKSKFDENSEGSEYYYI